MNWSGQQLEALEKVEHWRQEANALVFYLAGYAGTGKTTLAKHLAGGVSGEVRFAAYTGKAAYVLRQRGCADASTIHSLIYRSKNKSRLRLQELETRLAEIKLDYVRNNLSDAQIDLDPVVIEIRRQIHFERENLARPAFELNSESDAREAALIVIDECSMVDGRMGEDLLSFEKQILVLGDPAQLPPVKGSGFFTEREPDFLLTEIHRQSQDNPIIQMATRTRMEEHLPEGRYGNSRIVTGKISPEEALTFDQVLCGKNKTRRLINKQMRHLLGHNDIYPVSGDRLVCLRNNHEKGLLNGAIWYCDEVIDVDEYITMLIHPELDGDSLIVEVHKNAFEITEDPNFKIPERPGYWERDAEEFDFGYALTVHKAQGSQWENVLLFDQSAVFREDKWRWLYTGITRASEKITLAR